MKKVQVSFERPSFADVVIEVPDDMEISYKVDPENPSPLATAIWDWYDEHHDELKWSHDGCGETVSNVQEV